MEYNNLSNIKTDKDLLEFCKKKLYTINGIYNEIVNKKKLETFYKELKTSISNLTIFKKDVNNEFDIAINYILDLINCSNLMNSLFFLSQYSDSEEINNNLLELCYCLELSSIIKDITFNLPTLINKDMYQNQASLHTIFGETISHLTIASLSAETFVSMIMNIKKLSGEKYYKLNNCIDLIITSLNIMNDSDMQSESKTLFEKNSDKKSNIKQINILKKTKTTEGFYNAQLIAHIISDNYKKEETEEKKYLFKLFSDLVLYNGNNYLVILVKIINLLEKYCKLNMFMKCILNILLTSFKIE